MAVRAADKGRRTLAVTSVVDAAMTITHREGLSALTVRQLCADLSVTPPTIYHHVGNMQRLYELVSDAVITQIEVPDLGDWRENIVELVRRTRAIFADHPGVAAFVNGHKPLPAAIRLADDTVALLLQGMDHRTALRAYHVITVYNMGQMLVDGTESRSRRRRQGNPTFLPKSVTAKTHPALAESKSQIGQLNPGDTHLQGVRWILAGALAEDP